MDQATKEKEENISSDFFFYFTCINVGVIGHMLYR